MPSLPAPAIAGGPSGGGGSGGGGGSMGLGRLHAIVASLVASASRKSRSLSFRHVRSLLASALPALCLLSIVVLLFKFANQTSRAKAPPRPLFPPPKPKPPLLQRTTLAERRQPLQCRREFPKSLSPQDRVCSPHSYWRNKGTEMELLRGMCVPPKAKIYNKDDNITNVPIEHRNLGGNECEGDDDLYIKYEMEHLDFTQESLRDTCTADIIDRNRFQVPKIVHFVFGMKPDFGGFPFQFFNYMAIKMAHDAIKPDKIMLHYKYEPYGPYWDRVKRLVELVEIEKVPDQIFGNPVNDVAHKADVVRMQVMMKYGGIYLDSDVFAYRSFDPLLHHPMVMGKEVDYGLCNAIMISAPNSTFIRAWYESYRTFDDSSWNDHSVSMPIKLAKKMPKEICALPRTHMFYPTYESNHIKFIHEEDEYIFDNGYQYAYHAWNHVARAYLKDLSPTTIRTTNTSFTRLLRKFLDDDLV